MKTSDLLTNLSFPDFMGFNSFRINFSTYQNVGYEFTVNANILRRADGLRLDVAVNASFVKNKILQLPFNGQPKNRQGGIQVYDPKTGQLEWVLGLQEGNTGDSVIRFTNMQPFSQQMPSGYCGPLTGEH